MRKIRVDGVVKGIRSLSHIKLPIVKFTVVPKHLVVAGSLRARSRAVLRLRGSPGCSHSWAFACPCPAARGQQSLRDRHLRPRNCAGMLHTGRRKIMRVSLRHGRACRGLLPCRDSLLPLMCFIPSCIASALDRLCLPPRKVGTKMDGVVHSSQHANIQRHAGPEEPSFWHCRHAK